MGTREQTLRFFRFEQWNIAAMAIVSIAQSNVAIAEPSVRIHQIYFERDLMLLFCAVGALLIFNYIRGQSEGVRIRPIGRRITNIAKLGARFTVEQNSEKEIIPFAHYNWEPVEQSHYWCTFPEPAPRWKISIFNIQRVKKLERYQQSGNDHFLFARSKDESERVISPLQRKLVSRYRSQFSSISVLHLSPESAPKLSLTWLPSDLAVWNALVGFLDECLSISDSLECDPSLTICRGTHFWVEVSWPESLAAEWIQRIGLENPELELISREEFVGLRLHIAFPEGMTPESVHAATQQSA